MHKLIFLCLILNTFFSYSQEVVEVQKPEITNEIDSLFAELRAKRDSGFYNAIEILEKGMKNVKTDFEIHKIAINLGFLYTKTEQFDKCLDMWFAANKNGICFDFHLNDNPHPPYLSDYKDNKRFTDFIEKNDSLYDAISGDAKAEYFVNLPMTYDKSKKYPLLIILHGGIGSFYNTYIDWQTETIKNDFISVYPQGREIKGSFARSYGNSGINDITEVYNQVIKNYSVDTTSIILAGQSAGGALSLGLANGKIPVKGLFLAFPAKPGDFKISEAQRLRKSSVRVYMICGEQDKYFYSGQLELSNLLDSSKVENMFIKYPDLGHDFPKDFKSQIDKGFKFILDN